MQDRSIFILQYFYLSKGSDSLMEYNLFIENWLLLKFSTVKALSDIVGKESLTLSTFSQIDKTYDLCHVTLKIKTAISILSTK